MSARFSAVSSQPDRPQKVEKPIILIWADRQFNLWRWNMFRENINKIILGVLLLGLGVTGILSALYITRFGPGLNGDSIMYMQGASNLLAGKGYSTLLGRGEVEPIKGFPPMTSISLALANLGRADMPQTGRWLNAILFGLNIALAGLLVFRYSRAVLPAFLAAAMLAAQPSLITVHASVLSEGLFIFLLLLSIWMWAEYFWSGGKKWLVLGSLLTAICFLTRYIGLVLIPAVGMGLLLFGNRSWKDRLLAILLFGLISMIPVALWFARNQIISGSAIDRQIGLHLMSQSMRGLLVDHVLSWFYLTMLGLPWRIRVLLFGALFGAFLLWFGITVFKARGKGSERGYGGDQLPMLLALISFFYLLAIWVNSSLLDASTSSDAMGRYLTPLYVCVILMITCMAWFIARQQKGLAAKIFFAAIGVLLLVYYSSSFSTYMRTSVSGSGHGYTDMIDNWTGEVSLLRQLGPDHPIVTNDTQLLYALSDRYSYGLPTIVSTDPDKPSMVDENKLMGELSQDGYLVIIIKGDNAVSDFIPENILTKLVLYKNTPIVWVYVPTGFKP
jgi:hypothetical protein